MFKPINAALLIWLSTLMSMPVLASDVDTAQQLVTEERYKEAFELLEPLEFDLSGDEAFDLLFGFTALETGRTSLASLAFERVIATNPDNNTARFHLARAYYVLSDFDGARREFELLLSMNPTAGLRETVGQYLDAIAARKPGAPTNYSSYLALGIGNDSNVNGATSHSPIYFPGLGGETTLGDDQLEDDDVYVNFSAGIYVVHQSSDVGSYYYGGDLFARSNDELKDLNNSLTTLRGGYQHAFGNKSIRLGLTSSSSQLDGEAYQKSNVIDFEWRNTIEQRTQIGVVTGFSAIRFDDAASQTSNYDDFNIRLSALHVIGDSGSDILSGAITLGFENDKNERADGNMNYFGISFTGQMAFTENNNGYLVISLMESRYDEENLLFLEKRAASQFSVVAGASFAISKNVSLRPALSWSDTNSNFKLYDTNRTDVSLTLRADFL